MSLLSERLPTPEEWDVIRGHMQAAYAILSEMADEDDYADKWVFEYSQMVHQYNVKGKE